jgi:outer membrane protein insertion porin family/translocation and assembly module TamA
VSQGREWDSFLRPHTACGVGPRYDTPIGPIRIDLAYRIPGLQNMTNRVEGIPRDLLGLPINISFGIGEAF